MRIRFRVTMLAPALLLAATAIWAGGGQEPLQLTTITEPIKIQVWYSLGARYSAPLEEIIEKFNAENDLITVEGTFQGNYPTTQEKLLASYIAGNPPVLSQLEQSLVGSFVANDALVPLEEFIKLDKSFDRNDLLETITQGATYSGKLYGLPINVSTPVLYIHRDLFRKAGLDPDKGPKNWDEVYEFSKKIADPAGPVYGVRVYNSSWILDSYFRQMGGRIFNDDETETLINSQEIKDALAFWRKMVVEKVAVYQGGGDGSKMDAASQVGISLRSTGSIQWYKDNVTYDWGVAPFALGPNKAVSLGGGNIYMLRKTSRQAQQAGWDFLSYLTTTENQIHWSVSTGYMVSRKSALKSPEIQAIFKEDPRYETTYDQLKYAFARPKVEAWSEIEDLIMEAVTRIVQQGESVDILDRTAKDINELL